MQNNVHDENNKLRKGAMEYYMYFQLYFDLTDSIDPISLGNELVRVAVLGRCKFKEELGDRYDIIIEHNKAIEIEAEVKMLDNNYIKFRVSMEHQGAVTYDD